MNCCPRRAGHRFCWLNGIRWPIYAQPSVPADPEVGAHPRPRPTNRGNRRVGELSIVLRPLCLRRHRLLPANGRGGENDDGRGELQVLAQVLGSIEAVCLTVITAYSKYWNGSLVKSLTFAKIKAGETYIGNLGKLGGGRL